MPWCVSSTPACISEEHAKTKAQKPMSKSQKGSTDAKDVLSGTWSVAFFGFWNLAFEISR
jgi:hypothetical protein